jgi:hypothetical protein
MVELEKLIRSFCVFCGGKGVVKGSIYQEMCLR